VNRKPTEAIVIVAGAAAGLGAIVAGVWLIYEPAGLLALGIALLAAVAGYLRGGEK